MAYTPFDRFVAWCRFRAAAPHIRPNTCVCDIGCGLHASFLQYLGPRIRLGVGLDNQAAQGHHHQRIVLADITAGLPLRRVQFDHAVMLAVLEHLVAPEQVLREIHDILVPGGSLIMTWPIAALDPALMVLHRIGLGSDEMEAEEHQPRIPLPKLFTMLHDIGFEGLIHRRFELGLNNLLVAYKLPR